MSKEGDRLATFMRSGSDEVRTVDPLTGGEKGSKRARYDLIPVGPLRRLAEHFGYGATKYADRNWERGYKWSLSYAALMRHLQAFWGGEDIDADSGSEHITAVIWHAMALSEYANRGLGTDDRPHGGKEAVDKAWRQYVDGYFRQDRAHDPLIVGRPTADGLGVATVTDPLGLGRPGASYAVKPCGCPENAWLEGCPQHGVVARYHTLDDLLHLLSGATASPIPAHPCYRIGR